jgi:putative hydrolase of the HAD superfamily
VNVVFDFGGVLFRWQPQDFLARLLPEYAPNSQAAQALVADFFEGFEGDWGEFDRGTVEPEALAERIAARTGLPVDGVLRVVDAVPAELKPLPGGVDLLQRLHARGWPLYYLSNMPLPYAAHLESQYGFVRLFRAGVFSSRVQMIKPEPQIFAHAARVFDCEPAQTLFIDDAQRNVHAARAAGWQALHFRDAAQCEVELVARGLL